MDWTMIGTYNTNQYVTHQYLNKEDKEIFYSECFGNTQGPRCKFVQNVLDNV